MGEFGPSSSNPSVAPFWAAARESRLVLPHDPATGRVCWYPRDDGTVWDWRAVPGEATLYAFSVVRGPLNPLYDAPYAPGVVELDAVPGVRLVTQIVDCDFAAIRCGMPLDVCFRELRPRGQEAFIAPLFRPRR